MKMATVVLFSGMFASSVLAEQGLPGPPVAVLKYEWVQIRDFDYDSGLPDATAQVAPIFAPGERDPSRSRARATPIRITPPKNVVDDVDQHPRLRRDTYRYTVALRNLGERPISAVIWEYVIVDLHSRAELARLRFTTVKKIQPGKVKRLTASTWTPPTQTMSVQGLKHVTGPEAGESIEIRRIKYSDGSQWLRR